jgi:hypothetical protein
MRFLKMVLLVVALVLSATLSFAQSTYYWDGGDGSDVTWENPDNWDPDSVPFGDDAYILASPYWGYVSVDSDQSVHSLTVDYGMDLEVDANANLNVEENAYFGFDTDGYVQQSGGSLNVGNQFRLGDMNGAYGSYALNDGQSQSAEMVVGSEGTGYVVQYGGQNQVATGLGFGMSAGSSGSYELSSLFSDAYLSAGHEVIASGSVGYEDDDGTRYPGSYFTQYGGFHQIVGDNAVYNEDMQRWETTPNNGADLIIGDLPGSFGAYYLYDGDMSSRTALLVDEEGAPVLNDQGQQQYIGGNEFVGLAGRGVFEQYGGFNLLDGDLVLGGDVNSRGEYYLYDGYLAANLDDVRSEVFIGSLGDGYFYQEGGEFNAENSGVYLGAGPTGHGVYEMIDGEFRADGMSLGEWAGTGEFKQSGGTVTMTDFPLWLARQDNSTGKYELSGEGQLNVENGDLVVGNRGHGEFWQSGGIVSVSNNVVISATPDGTSSGEYHLSGGRLDAGTVNNYDRFFYSGGELNASIANSAGAVVEFSGPGTRVVNGTLHNYGAVRAVETTVQVTGEFRNFAELSSDPSTWYFQDLIVERDGYIKAQGNDQFNVAGKFVSYSDQSEDWQTGSAQLLFDNAAHEVVFNSQDLGPVESGYTANFAWGTVDFGYGNFTLKSQDEAGTEFGALYTWTINGIDYVLDNQQGIYLVNNIAGDSNIYYDPASNPWLEGKTFDLAGSSLGKLRPVGVVPEPVSSLLFLLGGGVVFAAGRLRRRG